MSNGHNMLLTGLFLDINILTLSKKVFLYICLSMGWSSVSLTEKNQ